MRAAFGLGGFCVIFGLPRGDHGNRFVPIDDSVRGRFIHDTRLIWKSHQIYDEPTAFPGVDGKDLELKERGREVTFGCWQTGEKHMRWKAESRVLAVYHWYD